MNFTRKYNFLDILQNKTVDEIMSKCVDHLKEPRNYGVTVDERESIDRAKAEERIERENAERDERERLESEEFNLMKQRKDEWV